MVFGTLRTWQKGEIKVALLSETLAALVLGEVLRPLDDATLKARAQKRSANSAVDVPPVFQGSVDRPLGQYRHFCKNIDGPLIRTHCYIRGRYKTPP